MANGFPGRPRHYDDPADFDAKVDEFFAYCAADGQPVTWTGLALYLGFSSRQSIDEYMQYEGFSDPVRKAKARVENEYEKRLHGNSPTGSIFALKNMGWSDRQELALSGSVTSKNINSDMSPDEAARIYAEELKADK